MSVLKNVKLQAVPTNGPLGPKWSFTVKVEHALGSDVFSSVIMIVYIICWNALVVAFC